MPAGIEPSLLAVLLAGLIAAASPPAEDPRDEQVDAPPAETRLIGRWCESLRKAKRIQLRLDVTRSVIDRKQDGQTTEEVVRQARSLQAVAAMTPDSIDLTVYERDEHGTLHHERPIYERRLGPLERFERLWDPDRQEYRVSAEVKEGDTEHVDGCMFGSLLDTWAGTSAQAEHFERTLGDLDPLPETRVIAGRTCHVFRPAPQRDVDQESGRLLYERVDTYCFDDDAVLRQWLTEVTNAYEGEPYRIVQDRRYEITVE